MTTAPPTRSWPSARELVGPEPPTDDDVPTTPSGERLDTAAKIREFLEQLNAASAR